MTTNLKATYDALYAEESLKAGTVAFLRREMARRGGRTRRAALPRMVAALACLALVVTTGLAAARAYFTPVAYVDLDVNPSVELLLNRFDRVIDAYAYNPEGEALLAALSLRHRDYEAALLLLMDEMSGRGYLGDEGLLSVTVQTGRAADEARLLAALRAEVNGYMERHHSAAQTDIFPVSSDARSHAHDLNLSPAKYLAIQALIAVDPTASVEGCRGHSIGELQAMTRAHGNHHGTAPDTTDTAPDTAPEQSAAPQRSSSNSSSNSGHNGKGGHH